MTEPYLEAKKHRDEYTETKGETLFGLFFGFLLFLAGIFNNLPIFGSNMRNAVLCIVILSSGLLLMVIGVAVPSALKWPYKGFVILTKAIGNTVFFVVLTVVYSVFILPVGIFWRRSRNAHHFFEWKKGYNGPNSTFLSFRDKDKAPVSEKQRHPFIRTIVDIFGTFVANKRISLVPVLVILVLLGLLLFFVSTSTVFNFFIYTLF